MPTIEALFWNDTDIAVCVRHEIWENTPKTQISPTLDTELTLTTRNWVQMENQKIDKQCGCKTYTNEPVYDLNIY